MTIDDHLAAAAAAHTSDVEALVDLSEEQIDYLARVHELEDPLTDGLECDFRRRL